ncbi:MAG: DNA methyltransferase, partial [Candidatus Hodarchaeales archaeon]
DQIPSEVIQKLTKRVTLTHFCCQQLFQIDHKNSFPTTFEELISNFDTSAVHDLANNSTFSVQTKRIGEPIGVFQLKTATQDFSRYIGAQILKKNPKKKVNLDNPKEIFISVLSEHGIWFGKLISSSLRSDVRKRSAHKRPFFHPSSMNPLLQRTLINLAALNPGDWLLDPFCGTGGSLIEAARMGIRSVGVEVDRKILWGAYLNLKADNLTKPITYLLYGDATRLSFQKGSFSAIVTDPPYGTAASTKGFDLQELLLTFFREAGSLLIPQGRVVIAVPSTLSIEEEAARILNATFRKFLQYVHRSLTRKIIVFFLR